MSNPRNKLNQETSPYLLQHADNPVNWQAWNSDSLEQARRDNKPILLSIGYSACHWCHVMAHESFEDKDTARLMNEHFINIKVDREERPDLDKIYQAAHAMLTGRPGGWPLTVFLTPDDRMPFFAGTYFPRQPAHGMPSFSEILSTVTNVFQSRKQDIDEQNRSLKIVLDKMNGHDKKTSTTLNALPLDLARRHLLSIFDPADGGFSQAPKFPHAPMIECCLRRWALSRRQRHDDRDILHAALFTLEKMAMGGIFDHLGGGFCRYATDDQWMIPHFEKMLYDNAQLLPLYGYAWQITGNPLYKQTAMETARWIMHEMQSDQGGYYSALDADSEGEEGNFYLWTRDEIKALLDTDDYPIFAHCFGLDRSENFENKWHLHTYKNNEQLARKFHRDINDIEILLTRCKNILQDARSQRIRPGRDDKILTSWNALTITAMCIAGRIFGQPALIDSARRALDFIHRELWREQRFLVTHKDGKSRLNAYLDDYAYMLNALLQYLQCDWDNTLLEWAEEIAGTLIGQFEDKSRGGFYFTGHDHENLIQRNKSFSDDAIPSGNGIAAYALQKLGMLLGNTHFLTTTENCLKAANDDLQQHAVADSSLLHALEEFLNPGVIIIIRGDRQDINQWQLLCTRNYFPNLLCLAIPADIEPVGVIGEKTPCASTCAYICEGMQCLPPVTDLDEFRTYLENRYPDRENDNE